MILAARGISKYFPGVQALTGVSATFEPGSCHALMGENGAGKSTLGKILAGLYQPDEGELLLDGVAQHFKSPKEAQLAGINIVHQELLFCENMTVAENLSLSDFPTKKGFVDNQKMRELAREWLDEIGAQVDVDTLVGALPIAQQQLVQIAGALGTGAKILIFDEPTSSLGVEETDRLLILIKQLKASGVACIYVSHRLNEIFEVCDKITVLRDGKLVASVDTAETTRDQLVSMMIGRKLEESLSVPSTGWHEGDVLMKVSNFSSTGKFSRVNFSLSKGEILGIGGLVGAGRTELLEAIFGLDPAATGEVELKGHLVPPANPSASAQSGIGLVPEDRKRHGLVLGMTCKENISLPSLEKLKNFIFVNAKKERSDVSVYFEKMRVKAPTIDTVSLTLSGGNQQKLVLARWLEADCDVMLVDEPTRGVDVGAKAEIHTLLRSLAAEGKGVIVVSSDLPELLALSHRILVLRQGQIVGEELGQTATEETLMRKMAGIA